MSNNIDRLDQAATFKGRRSFTIRQDGTVLATYSGPGLHQEFALELAGISPNALREKHVATDMMVGLCIFLIPTIGFLWGAISAPFGSNSFWWFFGAFIVLLLPVGLCWREYIRKSYDLLVFAEPMTGNRLVLFRAVPTQAAVDRFVAALQAAIQKGRNIDVIQGSGFLSAELERLAALRDRGVLSEAEFQQAKSSLLQNAEKRSIGFQT
jgi:hypothetical protein